MAQAVANTLEQGGTLVVEAGTGIGKTFAYLVPALLSGARMMVCTATKTLQEQLFSRDIPQLLSVLGLPRRLAMLKGRSSYLCVERLARCHDSISWSEPHSVAFLEKVRSWSGRTHTGDLAELRDLDEGSPWIERITSTRESCTGTACPVFRQCHVYAARREALAADVLVVNHHLFFSDLMVRETGMAELLPSVQAIIFDEAHQLNEVGSQFLGRRLSTGQLTSLANDCRREGRARATGFQDWDGLCASLEWAIVRLRGLTQGFPSGARVAWPQIHPQGILAHDWQARLQGVASAVGAAVTALALVRETALELSRLHARAQALHDLVTTFLQPRDDESVRWLEVGEPLRMVECPLSIAGALPGGSWAPGQVQGGNCARIFTSASLGLDPGLSAFTRGCGLDDASVLRIPSPFDYQGQAGLYVPRDLPDPNDQAHSVAVGRLVARLARSVRGGTLVLTTNLRAASVIGDILQQPVRGASPLDVLIQGQQAKRSLIERFRHNASNGVSPCVLVGSASFWEGLDLPGKMVSVVVIDKLPFPSVSEPLVQARAQRIQALGRNVFKDYYLPHAAMALRQGAGRLIRTETDRGLLVICDGRLHTKSYGRQLLAALPPMRRLDDDDALQQALAGLTRTSTRVQNAI